MDKNTKEEKTNAVENQYLNDVEKLKELALLVKEIDKKKNEPPKTFWAKVWCVITNKKLENSNFLTMSVAALMQLFFNFIALILTFTAILCVVAFFSIVCSNGDKQYLLNYIFGAPLMLMLALITRGIANEIGREEDRNYIFTAFSGIVSFIALIVALIALFKQV